MLIQIKDLLEGDMVDLEGDPYADPDHDENSSYSYEYSMVDSIELETPTCVVVHFQDTPSIGFPPDHYVTIADDSGPHCTAHVLKNDR